MADVEGTITEGLTLAEVVSAIGEYHISNSEGFTLAEIVSAIGQYHVSNSDNITLAEVVSAIGDFHVSTSDDVTLDDVFSGRVLFIELGSGNYRIIRDDAEGYDLFLGTNEPPSDFTTPWASFTGATYETPALTPPDSGTRDYYIVLRRRNKFGLVTLNEYASKDDFSYKVTINAAGESQLSPPSAPINTSINAGPDGKFYVYAEYIYGMDATANQADTFLIYLSTDGTEPDPTVDTPTEVSMVKMTGIAKLTPPKGWLSGAFSESTIGRVLVRTRRSGTPDVDSINVYDPTILATATLLGPTASSDAGLFIDDDYKQGDND